MITPPRAGRTRRGSHPLRWSLTSCAAAACMVLIGATPLRAQDLVPGAYSPSPVGMTIFNAASTLSTGDIAFDPSLPVEDARARLGISAVGLGRTLGIAGRSASVLVMLPYVRGRLDGRLSGQFMEIRRAGFGDLAARVAVNLFGVPAMTPRQLAAAAPKTVVGASVAFSVPTGQYDSARVVNIGSNRWVVKPEIGVSRRRNRWTFEADLGATFFTDNREYVRTGTLDQAPIVSLQGHVIYTFRPGLWIAGDGNFWNGGRSTINGIAQLEQQRNSRLGFTFAVPIKRHQLRFAYSFGAFTTIGGDFQSVGLSYTYAWAPRP